MQKSFHLEIATTIVVVALLRLPFGTKDVSLVLVLVLIPSSCSSFSCSCYCFCPPAASENSGFLFFFGCPFQLRNHLRPSVAGVGCGGWSRGQGDYTACLLLGQRQKISARVCIEFKRRFIIIFCAPSYSPFSLLRFLPSLFISAYIYFFKCNEFNLSWNEDHFYSTKRLQW